MSGSSSVSALIGPLFIGLTLSVGFEGILLVQAYLYWRVYHNKDSTVYQCLVYSLCLLELFHSIVTVHAGYWYLVRKFGKSEELVNLVWSIIVELALTVVVSFIGRVFWISWLFALSGKNWWLTCIASTFSLAQLVLGILLVYEAIQAPLFSTIVDGKTAVIAQMLAADVGDLLISLSLSYYLRRHRTGIRKTELMLDRIIMFVVTRGFLTSGMGALQLISFVIWPKYFIFGIFHLIASKLYTNALLATLNSRGYIATGRRMTSENDTGTSLSLTPAHRQVNDPEVIGLVDKHSDSELLFTKKPEHTISSTSSGTTGAPRSQGRLHSPIDSIPTYHASLRDI